MEQRSLAELGILGVLAEQGSATLSGIQARLQNDFGRYWGYGHGVLSPAVERLAETGRISHVDDSGRYTIKDAGHNRLHTLLTQSVSKEPVSDVSRRHQLVVQFGFLHLLPVEDQEQVLTDIKDQLYQERDHWKTLQHSVERTSLDTGYRQDLIDLSLRVIDAHIDWIESLSPYT